MNLEKMAEKYRDVGYSERNADARVCQDIVLKAIERSNLGRNVTIKGGVVMRSITGNVRRATEDLDLDFIRYSLEDDSIRYFISKLNCLDGIRIEIKGNKIDLSILYLEIFFIGITILYNTLKETNIQLYFVNKFKITM